METNMMLQVIRFNKLLLAALLFGAASLMLFSSCSSDDDSSGSEVKETLNGNVARPTWTIPEQVDITSSMTAVVGVDLVKSFSDGRASNWQHSDQDVLAAFSGETCLGVGVWKEEAKAYWLYIAGTEGTVTLRYYSAFYKNLFEVKDAFNFVNDNHLGTVAEPYAPTFTVAK